MTRRATRMPKPRMLTAQQAAAYLGYETTDLLGRIPVKPVRMVQRGAGCMPKYDRRTLDAWLDRLSGLSVAPAGEFADEATPDDIFDAWKAQKRSAG